MIKESTGVQQIEAAFQQEKPIFIPFITAGFPTCRASVQIALTLEEAGAGLLELGVPYSDPLADGPTIQTSSQIALQQGVTLPMVLEIAREMREQGLEIPIILFTYYNPVLQYGIEKLIGQLEEYGIDGLLIPDLPFEEADEVKDMTEQYGRSFISLVAPTSQQRVQMIASSARGFLYCVSSLGVTGARHALDDHVVEFLEEVNKHSSVPVAVGFGISKPEQVKLLAPHCQGYIVGSALINVLLNHQEELRSEEPGNEGLLAIKRFVKELQSGLL
jgi:tryptophan synthase alpha chain